MNLDEKKMYETYCKGVDDLSFPSVKAKIIAAIQNPSTSTEGVLLFAEWFFHKLKIIFTASQSMKKDLFGYVALAIKNCRTITIKMKYLHWNDVDYSQQFMHYFYTHRFDQSLFIEQMLNDSSLLKWSQNYLDPDEIRKHFLTWIQAVETYEQRSNLLDVLLRFFPLDKDVRKVHDELKNGDTLYDNEQNVHDKDVEISTLKVIREMHQWYQDEFPALRAKHPNVYTATLTSSDWVTKILLNAGTRKEHPIIRGVLQRMSIDKTTFKFDGKNGVGLSLDTFEILFILLNFIMTQPDDLQTTMMSVLLEELCAAADLCITGYVARFINAIQGLTDRFQKVLPFWKQLHCKVNYDLSKALVGLPENSNAAIGSYDNEYQKEYFDFIKSTISLQALYENYGQLDVYQHLPSVLQIITGNSSWKISNDKIEYTLEENESEQEDDYEFECAP